ncbi:MAG: biosynthetic arginine decarboxylase [Deltaproteobacteria bacterium]|nr:biosynthetic arginine decarboxylase [Deltaproteobacteria bacterium]
MKAKPLEQLYDKWTVDQARELYGIDNWGAGYFTVNAAGEVCVCPDSSAPEASASLIDIIDGLRERGQELPVLLRFEDILASRIRLLNRSFATAIKNYGYKGAYRGVFPIKVNQQQQVVEEITTFGKRYHHGLEAGSKAELIAAMAYLDDPDALLICNGYKDEHFIRLALYARMIRLNCVLVIETLNELPMIVRLSREMGVKPVLGVRIKLSATASGHWKESGGDRSVFGLSASQIIEAVDMLKAEGMLDCLQLLHYHLGSQLPNIRQIRDGIMEACRIYVGLIEEGAPMGMLDLGGGLAVDYDGSHTNFSSSCNYTLDEYCRDVVEVVQEIMDDADTPHPVIVTESGRAMVAYYSVLIFNIMDASRFAGDETLPEIPDDASSLTRNIHEAAGRVREKNLQELYHDAIYYRDEARELFKRGQMSIRERALVERIFWYAMQKVQRVLDRMRYVPDDFEGLNEAMSDIYYGNLSVFQSLPDVWAIDQILPVMPIHRLKEPPKRQAVISDITCDCDGKIDRFIDLQDVARTLPLHELKPGQDYLLGVFLVGAYQETLGDLHNLLGDTNVASVRIGDNGEIEYARELEGDSVEDVLSYVEYDPRELTNRFREKAERAVREGVINGQQRRLLTAAYEGGLRGYTYYGAAAADVNGCASCGATSDRQGSELQENVA